MNVDLAKYKDGGLLLSRLVLVFIFLWHGVPKALNPSMAMDKFAAMGFPAFLGPIVGVVEVLCALAILVGLWHMWANLILAAIIVVAIVFVQLPQGVVAGLERDLLIVAMALTLASFGPGKYAWKK